MKLGWVVVCAAVLLSVASVQATPVLGFAGIESGTPIAGQEDVVIYNLTGGFGCSTPGGTPICTAVTFQNTQLLVNGTVTVSLGDIDPGVTESYTFPGGTFVDGSILSLEFSATLSATDLVDDLGNSYTFEAPIHISGIATDGDLTSIVGEPSLAIAPEPSSVLLLAVGMASLGLLPIGKRTAKQASVR